jgi:hypothetical protein
MFKRSNRISFPKLPFALLRFVQVLCSVAVMGVLGYFIYHLWQDGYSTPYEFSLLDFASSATLLNFFVTSILLCCGRLSPTVVIVLDSFLTVLWTIAFALLVRAMGKTTTQKCDTAGWGNSDGIRVCHMFKVLVAFSFIAIVSFAAMVVTAVVARKRGPGGHKYQPTVNPANMAAVDTAYGGVQPAPAHVPSPYAAPPPAYGASNVQDPKPTLQPTYGGSNQQYYG